MSGEKLKATKSKAEKHDAVDNQPDKAAGDGCKYQPTPLERCVDGQVDELRKQKSDSRGDDQRRRGEGGRQRSNDNEERKSTRLTCSHQCATRMPSSA